MMAIGAVLLSIPLAFFFAIYGYAIEGMNMSQSLMVYSMVGTAILLSFTVSQGVRVRP